MLDDFFLRALLAGICLAVVAGPLGCLVVWRKMAFFGDTLAHAALLGIGFAILTDLSPLIGVPLVTLGTCVALLLAQRSAQLSNDTILAILAHATLACGLVLIALTGGRTVNLEALLFGDILTVSRTDVLVIFAGSATILGIIIWQWRRLLALTVSPDIAEAEGLAPRQAEWLFMILIAILVSIALKLVGVLLITALLIIPAAAARHMASSPESMARLAALCGVIAVAGGLYSSAGLDTPSGPSVIIVAAMLLVVVRLIPRRHLMPTPLSRPKDAP